MYAIRPTWRLLTILSDDGPIKTRFGMSELGLMYLSAPQPWVVIRCHNLVVLSGPRVLCHEAKQDFENDCFQLHEVGWKCLFVVRQRNRYVAFDRTIKHVCSYRWCH